MHMLVFCFFPEKTASNWGYPCTEELGLEKDSTGKAQPASRNAANAFGDLPKSHSAIKTKASALSVALKLFAFHLLFEKFVLWVRATLKKI